MTTTRRASRHRRPESLTPTRGDGRGTARPTPVPTSDHDHGEELDAGWLLEHDGLDPLRERAVESLFALSNGYVGTRATLPVGSARSTHGTFLAGVFDDGELSEADRELVHTPEWLRFRLSIGGRLVRVTPEEVVWYHRALDMRRGQLTCTWLNRDPGGRLTQIRVLSCVSLADRRLLLQRIEITPQNYTGQCETELLLDAPLSHGQHLLRIPSGDETLALGRPGSTPLLAFTAATTPRWSPAPAATPIGEKRFIGQRCVWDAELGSTYRLDKLVTVATSREDGDPVARSRGHLERVRAAGLDAALEAHEHAWARRWSVADVRIEGDADAQQALRFAAYHLIGAASPEDDRVSIGARGLTGDAYKGHAFWDTEVFMLPFFVLTEPAVARSLLIYRLHTLPAAREKARALGYRGALYAWESADDGREAAPSQVVGPLGEVVPILTGAQEHHISADIAYAIWQYWRATRDDAFFIEAGAEMLLETARFWASRASFEEDGRCHIRRVMGPDEYHETVDDNAYTNGMAAWNLRRGLETAALLAERWPEQWQALRARLQLAETELGAWGRIANTMVSGLESQRSVIEQFAGYDQLEEIDLAAHEPRSAPMDVLLGRERTQRAKVVKQADALLLVYLLWAEHPPEVRRATFQYYEPRTAHGSSLSPGIHAAVAARLGDLERALAYFRQTAATDLGDGMGNSAGGVHLGALGSLWQATVMGFGGVELRDEALKLQPRLPAAWRSLGFKLRWRGRTVRVLTASDPPGCVVRLESGDPLAVTVGGVALPALTSDGEPRTGSLGEPWELHEES